MSQHKPGDIDPQQAQSGEHSSATSAKSAASETFETAEQLYGDDMESMQLEIEVLNKKVEENWDKAVRATAELENVKRRAKEDVTKAHKFALEQFAKDLLPVIDSLEKALEMESNHPEDIKAIHEGVALTMKLFLDTIKKFGVEQSNPINEVFDPHLHEAMSMIKVPNAKSQTIIEVFQRGYTLNGRVIRPARVVVAE